MNTAIRLTLYFVFTILFLSAPKALAVQKAKIVSPEVDIYSASDFDSDILESVKQGETYMISDQVFGPFYKIKLKSGKVGFVPDTEVDIEGKGRVSQDDDSDPFLSDFETIDNSKNKNSKNTKKNIKKNDPDEDADEDEEPVLHGLTLQLINFHEDTLGGVQIDDLTAIGYKQIASDFSWEVLGSVTTPKYYTEKLSASVKSVNLWGDLGFSAEVNLKPKFSLRYGAALFTHFEWVKVESSTKTYDMQDLTVGAVLEGAALVKFKKFALDFSLKYFFDRNQYGGLGITLFF